MEYIRVTKENIENEHICCAISSNKDIQAISKKNWLKERFDDGLVFLKSIERGKCFIEYIPAENAWNPINADGYMYIDCLWVASSFKGNGYSNDLLNVVLCQDLVQVKMRNFSHFNPPEAQPQCVFFHTIVRIHLVTYSYNGYEFVSYCRKLPDIQKSTGMPAYSREF